MVEAVILQAWITSITMLIQNKTVYQSKITIQSCNQTKTMMARENQGLNVTNTTKKDEPTLCGIMKSFCKSLNQ